MLQTPHAAPANLRPILEQLERGGPPQTLPELFTWRARLAPDAEALRHKVGGRWRSISYGEWEARVRAVARGLVDLVAPGDRVSILSENRPEWTYADLAVLALGGVVAPIYPTDPPRDTAYVLNDCGARIVFVSTEAQLAKVRDLWDTGQLPRLERAVVFDPIERGDERVLDLRAVLRRERARDGADVERRIAAVRPDDLATLVYTSGTTGDRKGVMLTHANLVGNVDRAVRHIGVKHFHEPLMLSFLPLCHSLERTCGYYVALRVGATIAYAESIERLPANLLEVRPTILVSVPRVYEKVHARVQASAAASPIKRRLLAWASDVGRAWALLDVEGRPKPPWLALRYRLAHRLVFRKLLERLGGRLAFACTGGAPMPKEIAIFMRAAGVNVIEGYGLTETSPILTLNGPERVRFGSVGRAIEDVELRIEPEEGAERPGEGEILARGPNVMRGYLGKPEDTAAVLGPDGWFRTGDVGTLDADGFLFITDRKKELLKTSGGKYVAPAPIEGRLRLHPLVEQACLVGDRRKYCVALVVPRFQALEDHLGRRLPARDRLDDDPQIRALYQALVDEVNRDLGSWERIKRFTLLPAEMSQETGELTPTQKLKRRVIDERYRARIDRLYPEG